ADPAPEVRRAAVQWGGEERLTEHAEATRGAAAKAPASREGFTAWLAAGAPPSGAKPDPGEGIQGAVVEVLHGRARPAARTEPALRMLRPDPPALKADELRRFAEDPDAALRLEAVRTLAVRADADSQAVLRRVAEDRDAAATLRLTATAGLGH